MGTLEEDISRSAPTRIAIYDDFLSSPRVVDIEPTDIARYIEEIAVKTYELSQQKGGSIPYEVIREVSENFIHAYFKDPCISIFDNGNTIKFTDQGPGIADKQKAQQVGITSATTEMRKYILGVGSGFTKIKEQLSFRNGRLIIEDNIKEGTVITIKLDTSVPNQGPVIYRETPHDAMISDETATISPQELSEREYNILALAQELGLIGPSDLEHRLDISLSTGYRALEKLENMGMLQKTDSKKRMLTDLGLSSLNR